MPDRLETRLADLGRSVAYPAVPRDLPERVAERIRRSGARRADGWWSRLGARPMRRGLLLAAAALLLLAAAVVAAGIFLPGLRIVFLPPGTTLPPGTVAPGSAPVVGPLGSSLGLGQSTDLAGAARVAGFDPILPADPGAPDEVFTLNERVTMVWRTGPDLPEIAPGIGLLVTEFRGTVDTGFYEKQLNTGATSVAEVRVGGDVGYWLQGEPHVLVYRAPSGVFIEETRRMVGDVLIWRRGELTMRIESGLGRDATIALAESMMSP